MRKKLIKHKKPELRVQQTMRKTSGPHEKKLYLEEFEASGARRVTTATVNIKTP